MTLNSLIGLKDRITLAHALLMPPENTPNTFTPNLFKHLSNFFFFFPDLPCKTKRLQIIFLPGNQTNPLDEILL